MKHELLSPAGSFPVFKAVLAAGADAVYLGGDRYSARALAPNFSPGEILDAIDLAHLYGRKVFLAVNTLLKGKEMGRELHDYILPFYERGLDAIIVQDFGVFSFIKKYFPDLPIHVSTQMSVASAYGAKFLKNMGAKRIIPARELTLTDIRDIYDKTGMELECFIHGALCYCYSGDCLMSSLIGARSGNRGRCAQPCRLPYKVMDQNGTVYPGRGSYPLSLKDLCAIELIPKLSEAGVYSFKIEGRMKSLEYAAGVTAIYRKYMDIYEEGPADFHVSKKDIDTLMALGNRSGFTKGYYGEWSGREMVTPEASSHTAPGTDEKNNWPLLPIPIEGKIKIKSDEAVELTVSVADDENINASSEKVNGLPNKGRASAVCRSVAVTGPVAQIAKSRPVEAAGIKRRIEKTGDTSFAFSKLEVEAEENCFVPIGQINELRRTALFQLREGMLHCFRRTAPEAAVPKNNMEGISLDNVDHASRGDKRSGADKQLISPAYSEKKRPLLNAVVSDITQLEIVLASPVVDMVSLDLGTNEKKYFEKGIYRSEKFLNDIEEYRRRTVSAGRQSGFCFPYVFGSEPQEVFDSPAWDEIYSRFDLLWARSYDSLGYCLTHLPDRREHIRLDGSAYVFSPRAWQAFSETGISGYTASPELNRGELSHMPNDAAEFTLYGYQPVMVTANCLHKNYFGCQKGSADQKEFYLSDRTGREFFVRRCCRDGLNIIYNSRPLNLLHRAGEIADLGFGSYRISFTTESALECGRILDTFVRAFILGESIDPPADSGSFTNGHFHRGVQ
ncbi:MAG: U32 family peptidase [Clostridiales bacterium]|nr:U32 family peptidase [Clostridiales bacterium]